MAELNAARALDPPIAPDEWREGAWTDSDAAALEASCLDVVDIAHRWGCAPEDLRAHIRPNRLRTLVDLSERRWEGKRVSNRC